MRKLPSTPTPAKPKPEAPPERHARLVVPPDHGVGLLRITTGKESADYILVILGGSKYRMRKVVNGPDGVSLAEPHAVRLGQDAGCTCDGYRHHSRCKHVAALAVLRAKGVI
jgi:hypothetical protein